MGNNLQGGPTSQEQESQKDREKERKREESTDII